MKNLLIIDDSKTVIEILKMAVQSSGKFRGFYAHTYTQAKALLEQEKFFAAIVDLELPDCKTAEALDLTLGYGVPTIALTGSMSDDLRERILAKPLVDYIIKENQESINNALIIAENLLIYEYEKILIVDDSKTARALLSDMLNTLTFTVVEAQGSKEALEILKRENGFCAILVDYEMPQMNGIQLIQELRKIEFKKTPVIIGVTSNSDYKIRLGLLKAGANDVFLKPFVKEEFNAKLANALRLAESEQKAREYLNMVENYIMIMDADSQGVVVSASPAFIEASGYELEDIIGKHMSVFIKDLKDSNDLQEKVYMEVKNYKKDGSPYWISVNCEPILNKLQNSCGYRIILQDVSAKKHAQKMADTDKLTELYNRRRLEEELMDAVEKAKLISEEFSVIMVDIDHFKKVNDNFGHQAGDEVLRGIANVLHHNIRKADIVGRWGGEEFLIIAKGSNLANSVSLAEKLRSAIETHSFTNVNAITASFGVSSFRQNDTQSSLFARADEALYKAKARGRNAVEALIL